jgi:hypothetical protein
MNKHTPGPWRLDDGYLVPRDGLLVGRLYCGPEFCDEINANATLAATAPELLAALVEAVEFQNDDTECDGNVRDCPRRRCITEGCMIARVNRWRAVIAKAEGRT